MGGATLSELREISSPCRTLPTPLLGSAGLRGLVDSCYYRRHDICCRFEYLSTIEQYEYVWGFLCCIYICLRCFIKFLFQDNAQNGSGHRTPPGACLTAWEPSPECGVWFGAPPGRYIRRSRAPPPAARLAPPQCRSPVSRRADILVHLWYYPHPPVDGVYHVVHLHERL